MIYHTDWFEEFENIEKSLHPWDIFHFIVMYDLLKGAVEFSLLVFVEEFYIYIQ